MSIRSTLDEIGIRPRKSLGQNFLCDANVCTQIVEFAGICESDSVVEVGPGLGALTKQLCKRAKRCIVIEIEQRLCEYLGKTVSGLAMESVVWADVRSIELETLKSSSTERFVIVSNVPYSLSSELFLWIIRNRRSISRASLLFQREFAEKLAQPPGSRKCGPLSIQRELWSDSRLGSTVSGDCFHPKAAVDSRMLELRMLAKPRVEIEDEEFFERVVRAAFSKRRKTLANSLSSAGYGQDKAEIAVLLNSIGIAPQRRAETLTLEEFARLTAALLGE